MLTADFHLGFSPADVPLYPVAGEAHGLHLPLATVRSCDG